MTTSHSKNKPGLLGAHTSIAGGLYKALLEGQEIEATTVQIFTANQRRWDSKPLEKDGIDLWHKTRQETGITTVMSHDSYLINLGSPNPESLQKSRHTFREEIERCLQLEIAYLNFHPGAALTTDPQQCLDTICESLFEIEPLVANSHLRLLIETTAGQGSTVGYRFEEIAYLVSKLQHRLPIGVCIDTCHIFVSGYNLCTAEACDLTLKEFDRIVGLQHLYAFHLNDSLKGLGSRIDRHQPLGEGKIGMECFQFLMQDPRCRHLPKYLETPGGLPLWKQEIASLRQLTS